MRATILCGLDLVWLQETSMGSNVGTVRLVRGWVRGPLIAIDGVQQRTHCSEHVPPSCPAALAWRGYVEHHAHPPIQPPLHVFLRQPHIRHRTALRLREMPLMPSGYCMHSFRLQKNFRPASPGVPIVWTLHGRVVDCMDPVQYCTSVSSAGTPT
jgi:hypothetical protein